MSLGIALMLEDMIFLVSDGRETTLDMSAPTYFDDKNKIVLLEPSVAIMSLGLTQLTEYSLKNVLSNYSPEYSYEKFLSLLQVALEAGWRNTLFLEGTDFNASFMQSSFMTGGFIGDRRFIAQFTYNKYGRVSSQVIDTPVIETPMSLICGQGQNLADDIFYRNLIEELKSWHLELGFEDRNKRIIKAAADTIEFISTKENMVGGTIRYVILERGKPFKTDVYSSLSG